MPGTRVITKRVSFSSATTSTPPSSPPTPEPKLTPCIKSPSHRRGREAEIARTPTRELFKSIVSVYVGPTKQVFQVHKEMLCDASPFFAAAFDRDSNFSESSSGSVTFPEIRPSDFEYLVQWLYTHTLSHEEVDVPKPAHFRLIRLYILADLLRIEALRNDIIDKAIEVAERYNSVPTPDDTRLIEEEVREKTALRMLIVDLFVYKKTDQVVEKHQDAWSEAFLREIFCQLKRTGGNLKYAPFRDPKHTCDRYHEHKETPPCSQDRD